MATKSLILDSKQLQQKIKRIAFEIYERNFKEEKIVLAGIEQNGYKFAQLLQLEINKISGIQTILLKITLNKSTQVQTEIFLDQDIQNFTNSTIVLTDDVLNTGKVLAFSLQPFLSIETKKIQTAVIVDRSHQSFPIVADYVGYSLATTIKEHIEVSLETDNFGVYLH